MLTIVWIVREGIPNYLEWQVAVVLAFINWAHFILRCDKLPIIGTYVVMFTKILRTFLKVSIFGLLLILMFSVVLVALFNELIITPSPFASFSQTIVKTISMTAGDIDFDSISRVAVPFLDLSRLTWILFIIIMPVLFANILIGLAVENTQETLKQSRYKVLALQVEHILTVEELLLKCGCLQRWKQHLGTERSLNYIYPSQ